MTMLMIREAYILAHVSKDHFALCDILSIHPRTEGLYMRET